MNSHEVLGLPLAEAERLLAMIGVGQVEVKETAPPRGRRPEGPLRVVRQRESDQGVSLLVAATLPPPQGEHSHD